MLAIDESERAGRGPIVASTVRVTSSCSNVGGRVHAELDVEVLGPLGEQADQAGRGVLREQRRGAEPEHPAAGTGRAHLEHGAVLEAEHLDRPAGQAQPARA